MAPERLTLIGLALAVLAVVISACSQQKSSAATNVESVKIDDEWFHLELSLDPATRFRGLSDRTHIEEDGGMLFVFPKPAQQAFVMRDCPIPIDIIFLDAAGRIVAMHKMKAEDPRRPDEPDTGNPSTDKYEQRLTRYPSRYPAQFVIELAGNTLDRLELKEGDLIKLDVDGLKARAK